jgi:hypothetical protein
MGLGREILISFGVDVDAPSFKRADKALATLAAQAQANAAVIARGAPAAGEKAQAPAAEVSAAGREVAALSPIASGLADIGTKIGFALANAVSQVAELGGRLNKLGTGFKVNVAEMQGMEHAAGRLGVGADELTGTLSQLESKAFGAASGIDAGAVMAFGKMGVAIRKSNGEIKNGQELFESTVDRLKKMPDTIATQQKAIALLGETLGRQLGAAVRDGSFDRWRQDVKDFGAVLDDQSRGAVKRYGEEQSKVGLILRGLRQSAAIPLIDSLARVGKTVTESLRGDKSGGKALATATTQFSKLEGFASLIGVALFKALPIVGLVLEAFAAIGHVVGSVAEAIVEKFGPGLHDRLLPLVSLGGLVFAAFFPITALLGAILLVADDLLTFSKGGDSLFGRMLFAFDQWQAEFLKENPNDPWWLKAMKAAYKLIAVDIPAAWKELTDALDRWKPGAVLTRVLNRFQPGTSTEGEAGLGFTDPEAFFRRQRQKQDLGQVDQQVPGLASAIQQLPFAGVIPGAPGAVPGARESLQGAIDAAVFAPAASIPAPSAGSGQRVLFSPQVSVTVNAEGYLKEGMERTKAIATEQVGEFWQSVMRQMGALNAT